MADNGRFATLFKTKRPGMLVGSVKPDQLEVLIATIKQAKAAGKSIVLFLYINAPGEKTAGSIQVAVERDRPDASAPASRPIGGYTGQGSSGRPAAVPQTDPLADLFSQRTAAKPAAPADEGW